MNYGSKTVLSDSLESKKRALEEINAANAETSTPVPVETAEEEKPKPKKKRKPQAKTTQIDTIWICTECREAECATNTDSPLLLCEGKCGRPFHYPCAGLASLPPENESWVCKDCQDNKYICAVCQEYGEELTEVHKCEKKDCGLFFHESCLDMYDVDIVLKEVPNPNYTDNVEDENQESDISKTLTVPKFTCPAHFCATCSGGPPPKEEEMNKEKDEIPTEVQKGGKKKKAKKKDNTFGEKRNEILFRCLECPTTFHISCIPPNAKFHELALLCGEHALTSKLPFLDQQDSLQAQVEKETEKIMQKLYKQPEKVGKKIIKDVSDESNKWLFGLKGDSITKYDRQLSKLIQENGSFTNMAGNHLKSLGFCAPCSIQKEVHSKPPKYTAVHSNQYDPKLRPKRHPPSNECCQCKPKEDGSKICDETCMNRILGLECIGKEETIKSNSYYNCSNGVDCGNRALGRRQFTKCKPKRERGKGWGLVPVRGAKKGDLIQEYVGEIIDEETKKNRLEAWAKDHPNDPNFYIMSLEPGWYIDARVKGGLSRFINHSCGPNCKLIPMNVGGQIRVGIFALRDIKPGEFLCYDYKFDTRGSDKFVCRCGAPECRGTMNGGLKDNEENDKKKTKKDIWADMKSKLEKDKQFLEELEKDRKTRLNQVGAALPGEVGEGARPVAAMPTTEFFWTGLCLTRNVIQGSDFASRLLKKEEKAKKPKVKSNMNTTPVDVFSQLKSGNV